MPLLINIKKAIPFFYFQKQRGSEVTENCAYFIEKIKIYLSQYQKLNFNNLIDNDIKV